MKDENGAERPGVVSRRTFLRRVGGIAVGTAAFFWSGSPVGMFTNPDNGAFAARTLPELESIRGVSPADVDREMLQKLLGADETRKLTEYLHRVMDGRIPLLDDLLRQRSLADGLQLGHAQAVDYLDERGSSIGTLISVPAASPGPFIASYSFWVVPDRRGLLDSPTVNIGILSIPGDMFVFAAAQDGRMSDVQRASLRDMEAEVGRLQRVLEVPPVLARSNSEVTDLLTRNSLEVLPQQFDRMGESLKDQRIIWPGEYHSLMAGLDIGDPGVVAKACCCCCCCGGGGGNGD